MSAVSEQNKRAPIPDNMPGLGHGGRGGGGGPMRRFMPGKKPKNTRKTLVRLLKIYATQWRTLATVILLTVVSSLVGLSVPYLIGRGIDAFDTAAGTVDHLFLGKVLIALVSAYMAAWLIGTCNGLMVVGVTQKLVKALRRSLFEKLARLPLKFYDTRSHGDTMSRLTNDIDNISSTIAMTTTDLASGILQITGAFVMLLLLSPLLTLVATIAVPLTFTLTRTIAKRSRESFVGQQRHLGELNGIIEESITGIKMVKAFNRQCDVAASFEAANRQLRAYSTRAQLWAGLMMPLMNVINNISFALIACVGGVLSVSSAISVGTIASAITYSRQFGMPLGNIAGMFNNIQSALAGAERVFELLDEAEIPPDKQDSSFPSQVCGHVAFRDVSFSYIAGKPVLEHVSFTANPGEVIALVGETGAGKTTIVNLLTRFYDADSGQILIDGVAVQDMKREDLRKYFSVVLQDTFLFTGSIADNIRYARPEADEAQVQQAALLAEAHHFISRLPNGYRTQVSGSTDNLSQGQRQLLSISRAFLCDSPILILDEATSSVDTRTEKNIQRAMLGLMKDRTSFLIAHRLSTIRDADRIMVIGDRRIIESGTHDELMRRKGSYYQMVVSQTGGAAER